MARNADDVVRPKASGAGVFAASERFSRALLANVADMVTISDRDGRIIYASPATERVSGYTPEEFMARNPFDSIHPEDHPRCEEALRRLARNPSLSLDLEHRVRHKDGTWRWVEGTFTSLFDDPDVGGLLATVRAAEELAARGDTTPYEKQLVRKDGSRLWSLCAPKRLSGSGRESECVEFILDITERKRFEAEKARLESREAAMRAETAERERISRELHDRVAHSMGVVYQSHQLHEALTESAPERAREKLAVAEETTKSTLDQTRNLAIELRRSVAEETKNGLPAALRTLIETSAPDGVATELSFSGDESLVPRAVEAQVYLVMREAIRNALKHSGCQWLEASLEVNPGQLVGTVTDDGDGFDPEAASDDGRGIGLRSMRERAEMVGGQLHLTSHPSGGTTIEIRVPLTAG